MCLSESLAAVYARGWPNASDTVACNLRANTNQIYNTLRIPIFFLLRLYSFTSSSEYSPVAQISNTKCVS
jgi:hypothetical protein